MVLKNLSKDQKDNRNFLESIITGKETYVFKYNPETKS